MSRNRIGIRRPARGGGAVSYPFTITSIAPPSIALGAGPTTVNVNGLKLQAGDVVWINGVAQATTPISSTQLRITYSVADASVPGAKSVIVRRGSLHSNSRTLSVPYPVPTVGTANFDGVNLAITGTGIFAAGTYALIDGTIVPPFTYGTATTCSVAVPQSVIDIPGNHTIQLVNPSPGGGTSNSVSFPVKFGPVALVSQLPQAQFRGRPSGTITLTGDPDPNVSTFYPVTTVQVDGVNVPSNYVDPTHMTFSIPGSVLMAGGPHLVTATNPTVGGGGGVSNALTFTSVDPDFDAISISAVPQYFDGFDVTGHVNFIDTNFEATFNGIAQPTTVLDANNFVVSITSAAIAVPGVTTIRLRDTLSGATTNAKTMTVQAWDPSRLGATLRFWGDGSSLINDGGGLAQAWNDMSGGARHFTQATSTKRPQIIASSPSLNGKPVARFAGAQQLTYPQWLVQGTTAVGLIQKDRYTIYCVAFYSSTGTGQATLGETNGYIRAGASALGPSRFDNIDSSGAGNTTFAAAFDWVPTPIKPFVLRMWKGGGNIGVRANRNAENILPHGTGLGAFAPVLAYLGSGAAGSFMTGDYGECIICDSKLNATQMAILDNRLSYLYNLPFSAPGTQPKITSISPSSCTQYDLPFYILVEDLTGSFTPSSVVNAFDQVLPTQYLSATQLRARLTNDVLAQAGGMAISVANENGISAPTGLTIFAYADAPGVPNLHTTVPNVGQRFNDPQLVRVLGVGFTAASVITWNGNSLATTFISATEIRATLPAPAFDVLPGPILTVTDPSGASPTSAEITLTDWSPNSIVGLTGWYACDDVLTAGGKITQFNDKTGNGRHMIQSDPNKQAIYASSDAAFNGKPSAQFDGVDDTYILNTGTFGPLGAGDSVFAAVYRYLVVDGAGNPATQPFANDVMFSVPGGGLAAHLSPLTLIAYASDGSYKSTSHTGLVVNATQRCQWRMTGGTSLLVEIGDVASTPVALASFAPGAGINIAYINFSTNNAMNGKLAVWVTSNLAWPAQDSICWKNFCRYNYGTTA